MVGFLQYELLIGKKNYQSVIFCSSTDQKIRIQKKNENEKVSPFISNL